MEALRDGSWKTAQYKDYNFAAVGEKCGGGSAKAALVLYFFFLQREGRVLSQGRTRTAQDV